MISMQRLSLSFGEKTVLNGFSAELPERGIICMMGPSGCGKTTLLRVLLGLQIPDRGCVSELQRGEAAVVFQEDRLLPWCSVLRNLTEASGCSDTQALEMLAKLGLEADAHAMPEQLSGGMRRRIALARALLYPSRLLVMDEPLKGLDDTLKAQLCPLIREAAQTKPALIVTHDRAEADVLADRLWLMDGPPLTFRSDTEYR